MESEFETNARNEERDSTGTRKKPEFSVKMNGNYVGSAWLKDGKYGPYLSVVMHEDVPRGSSLYIVPTRANPGILG